LIRLIYGTEINPHYPRMPERIGRKIESKEERRRKIRELGFSNEEVIEYLAKHFTTEGLQRKIRSFQSAGFKNPIALIEKFPKISDLDINRVIQSLQSLGFTNPIALIEKFPRSGSLGVNHVKRRIRLIERLNTKFQLQLNPIEIIESYPPYLNYDLKRIFFYLRIASFYNVDEKFYRRLITENPFIVYNILYDLYSQNKISDIDEFRRLITKIRIFPKETRQRVQDRTKENLPKIIENLKQKQNDPNARFLLKLAGYLEALLKKEEERKRRKRGEK